MQNLASSSRLVEVLPRRQLHAPITQGSAQKSPERPTAAHVIPKDSWLEVRVGIAILLGLLPVPVLSTRWIWSTMELSWRRSARSMRQCRCAKCSAMAACMWDWQARTARTRRRSELLRSGRVFTQRDEGFIPKLRVVAMLQVGRTATLLALFRSSSLRLAAVAPSCRAILFRLFMILDECA